VDNKTHIANTDQEKDEVLAKFLTSFQLSGTIPDFNELLKIKHNGMAIANTSDNSCKTLGCTLSGPGDLLVFWNIRTT
jgi:hypothetical protein